MLVLVCVWVLVLVRARTRVVDVSIVPAPAVNKPLGILRARSKQQLLVHFEGTSNATSLATGQPNGH